MTKITGYALRKFSSSTSYISINASDYKDWCITDNLRLVAIFESQEEAEEFKFNEYYEVEIVPVEIEYNFRVL